MLSNPSNSTIETPVSSIPATSVSPIPSTSFIPASSFNSATPGNNSVLLDAFLPRSQINRTPPPSPTAPSLARRKPRFVASFSAPRTRSNPNFVPTELVKDPARKTWARFQNLRSKIDRTPSLLERLSRFTVKTPTSQDSTPTSSKSLASLTLNHGVSSPISFSEPSSVIREKSPRPPQQEAVRTVGHVDSQIDSDSVQTKEFQIPSAVDANQHHEAGRSHQFSPSVSPSAANSGPSIHVDGATDGGNNSAHIFQQRDPSAPNQEISPLNRTISRIREHDDAIDHETDRQSRDPPGNGATKKQSNLFRWLQKPSSDARNGGKPFRSRQSDASSHRLPQTDIPALSASFSDRPGTSNIISLPTRADSGLQSHPPADQNADRATTLADAVHRSPGRTFTHVAHPATGSPRKELSTPSSDVQPLRTDTSALPLCKSKSHSVSTPRSDRLLQPGRTSTPYRKNLFGSNKSGCRSNPINYTGNANMSSDDESDPSPLSDIAKMAKGQNSATLLTQLPSFACSPGTRFDRWVKQFENIANIASWNDEEKISMFTTKMTDKAYDIFQTFLDSCPDADFNMIKECLMLRFHGNETT